MVALLMMLLGAEPAPVTPPGTPAPAAATAPATAPVRPGTTAGPDPITAADGWSVLLPGLELGEFASTRAQGGDGRIRILRIDPARWRLRLFNASAPSEGRPLTAREWATRHHLAAAINASMYQSDMRSSVSLMRTAGHVNNPRLSKDRAILAFDPLDATLPPAQIIDRECQDFDAIGPGYGTLVQSIRMISCRGANVWAPQPRAFSTAAIGVDAQGRVLFIHARAPHTTHDLIDALLGLSIGIKGAMYVEGGHEAQMFVRAGEREMEFLGESGGAATGANLAWPIPNIVGVEAMVN
jgi:hypothetical protein